MSITLTIHGDSRVLNKLNLLNSKFSFEHIKVRAPNSSAGDHLFGNRTEEPQDSRKSLGNFEFAPFILSLAIPATYVLKKLIDPILEDIGKSLATIVKKCFLKIAKTDGISNHISFLVIVDNVRYMLFIEESISVPNSTQMVRVVEMVTNHWREGRTQSKFNNPDIYEIILDKDSVVIRLFDPFCKKQQ